MASVKKYSKDTTCVVLLARAAERIGGARDKYIKWGPYYRLGVWGHAPRNFLQFYML